MEESIFQYPDTNSTRANIEFLNRKFKNQRIAIIGLGGTGSYIIDQVAKTPVREIHLYDKDIFQLHNAFRAPGTIDTKRLDEGNLKKVQYYHETYSRMHKGIVPHDEYITEENISELAGFDCVFISIDKNQTRFMIAERLLSMNVPFIDCGLGVNMLEDSLVGALRVTVVTTHKNDHLNNRIGSEETGENEYSTNIQIADLNCLNAVHAVIKWKKISGFYQDLKQEHNILYFINTNKLLNEDNPT